MIIGMPRGRKGSQPPLAFAIGAGAHSLFHLLSSYRLELLLAGALFTMGWASVNLSWWVPLLVFVTHACAVGHPRSRSLLSRLLRDASTRRQLVRAARDSGFKDLRVKTISKTLPGELASVYVPRGATVVDLDKASRAMAGCLRVSDVRVVHDREDRSHAELSIIRRDPFTVMTDMQWPLLGAEQTNVREPMPMGLDEYGHEVKMRLLSRNLLVGGAPDAGKSTFLRMPTAYAALDPNARLWLMDGKRVEFEAWRTCARGFVSGRDLEGAVKMLTELYDEVDDRYKRMTAAGQVFLPDDMPVDFLLVDELPVYTRPATNADTKTKEQVKTIHGLLYGIVAQGRAAALVSIFSLQKPDANAIPTEIRDLIDNKFALHCNTRAMSNTILGDGAGEEGTANAAEIPAGQPGVGYYVGDDGVKKTKAFYVSHQQAQEVATRATSRQIDAEWSPA
jgi:S-DNA-T family DNA segregation ATPase FtsK/SpoIIIE